MKVADCMKCPRYERHTWSFSYKPANYHRIGVSHAFGWCNFHQDMCRNVRKCDQKIEVKDNEKELGL